jgi:hypothetical protein
LASRMWITQTNRYRGLLPDELRQEKNPLVRILLIFELVEHIQLRMRPVSKDCFGQKMLRDSGAITERNERFDPIVIFTSVCQPPQFDSQQVFGF